MLNISELAQVRQAVLYEMAEVEAAIHADHGSYTHLCAVGGSVFFAHHPYGVVIHDFTAANGGPPDVPDA